MSNIYKISHWLINNSGLFDVTPFYQSQYTELDDYILSEANISAEVGKAGSFTFGLHPSNVGYDSFVKLRSYIVVQCNDDYKFVGRVYSENKDFNNVQTIECEGIMAVLNDSLYPPPDADSDGNHIKTQSIDAFVTEILNNHNSSMAKGSFSDAFKHIYKGVINNSSAEYTYESSSNATSMDVLQGISDDLGGYFMIRPKISGSSVSLYLDYIQSTSQTTDESISSGTWPYWVYTASSWEVSTKGTWKVSVNRALGSSKATVTATIKMISPGGQSAPWQINVKCNGTTYTYSDEGKVYVTGDDANRHVAGREYTLTKTFTVDVGDSAGSLSGTIWFSVPYISDLKSTVSSWSANYGTKSGTDDSSVKTLNAEINFGENLLDITQESSSEGIYTVLTPYGAELEDSDGNKYTVTVESVNDGKKYVVDEDGVTEWGVIETDATYSDIESPSELLSKAKADLKEMTKSKVTITVSAVDLSFVDATLDDFKIGDKLYVKSSVHNISDYFVVKKQDFDLLNPSNNTLSLENNQNGYISKTFKDTNKYAKSLDKISSTYVSNKQLQESIENQVTDVKTDYALNTSKTDAPIDDDQYSEKTPDRQMGYFIWMRQRYYRGYSATPYKTTYSCITGDKGDNGDPGISAYSLVLSSSNGTSFINGNISTTLTASLYYGSEEKTATGYIWSRVTGNTELDKVWNSSHSSNRSNTQNITADDFDNNATFWVTLIYSGVTVTASISLTDLTDITTYIYYSDGTTPTINPTENSTYIGVYNGPPIAGGQPEIPPATTMWAKYKGADGSQTYFHVRYSNDGGKTFADRSTWSNTRSGVWNILKDKTWLTVKTGGAGGDWLGYYTDTNPTDSDLVTDYTWIKTKGDEGNSSYTYIRYSANSDGSDFTSSPSSDTQYIGIYTGPSSVAPTDKTAYTWSKYVGDEGIPGVSISTIQYWYVATSKSSDVVRGINPPDSQWTTDTTSVYATLSVSKPFRWSYAVITLSDGTIIYTDPCIDGTCGDYITATALYYKLTSADSAPSSDSSGWSSTRLIPSFANKYLWVKKVDTYFSGTVINTISLECMYGDNGATMNSVKYYYLASSNSSYVSVDDSGWTTDITNTGLSSSKPYLWMQYRITYTNGIESEASKPVKILNPATTYSLTSVVPYYISSNINSYNFTATSTGGWDFPADKYPSYGWTSSISNVVLSDQHKYLWVYFWLNGSFATSPIVMKTFGTQVTDMVQLYYISDSNSELTGGEWTDTSPNISSLPSTKYVWTRLKIVLGDDEIYSTPSLCSDITSLNSEIKNINGNITANMVTKSDLANQLAAYVSSNTYNAEYGSIEERLSAVELTSSELNVAFEGVNYFKSFNFSEDGLHISSGEEGAVETILDNDSFRFVDSFDVVQLELTAKGVDMHSAYINDTLDFKENNISKWRLSTYKDNSFNIDWIG